MVILVLFGPARLPPASWITLDVDDAAEVAMVGCEGESRKKILIITKERCGTRYRNQA